MVTPLSAPIPLRSTTLWGGYRDAVAIPHRYGNAGGGLIQYDSERRVFCWADHAVAGIDGVLVNGQPAADWTWRNALDSTGQAIALVEFGQPQDEGVDLIARGRGKLHPRTGGLMIDPAAVVWDVLANLAGHLIAESALLEFSRACERAGITVAGSIDDAAASVQTIVRGICRSIGAAFAPDSRAICWLWHHVVAGPARMSIDHAHVLTASARVADLCNDLTVHFGHEAGQPRGTVQMAAPDSIARFGRRTAILEAPWVAVGRVAYDVAMRSLQDSARPQWLITADGLDPLARVGDVIAIEHPVSPIAGAWLIRTREVDLDLQTMAISVVAPAGDVPAVHLIRQGRAYDPLQYSSIAVQTVGNDRVLTLTETDGRPIAFAAVTVRTSATTRHTDSAGRVSFPATVLPIGEHWLDITTADARTLETLVLIT